MKEPIGSEHQAGDLYPPLNRTRVDFCPCPAAIGSPTRSAETPGGAPSCSCTVARARVAGLLHRQLFDPEAYRIILFDQRGAGRSTPAASLEANTTTELVNDIETLREHLGVRRWVVCGGSWGSTLALSYAAAHPQACRALVLRGTWMGRQSDLEWWLKALPMVYPEYWQAFVEHIPETERHDLLEAYYRRLIHPDSAVHMPRGGSVGYLPRPSARP